MNELATNASDAVTADTRMDLAKKYLADGKIDKAEKSCRRILKQDKEHPEATYMMGIIAHHKGDNERAIRLIARAADMLDYKASALNDLGSIMMIENRLPEAELRFKRAIKHDPDLPQAQVNLAKAYVMMGKTEEASEILYAAMARDPENSELEELLDGLPEGKGVWFAKIRVENTNACRYKCQMCPREKMSRATGVMSPEDYQFFLERFQDYVDETGLPQPYKGLFFLHGYGEPLLDQKLAVKSAMVAEKFPNSETLIITTLGVRRPRTYFEELLGAGQLKNIVASFYGFQQHTYDDVQQNGHFETARQNLIDVAQINADMGHPCNITMQLLTPHTQLTMEQDPEEQKAFDELMAIIEPLGVKVRGLELHNFGNGRSYFDPTANKAMCSVVSGYRRRHLNVTWDLKIVPCCYDFNAEVELGDLRTHSIREIYEGEAYRKFLDAHRAAKLKDYPVCVGCDRR